MVDQEWFSNWKELGPFLLENTGNVTISCIAHINNNFYAIATYNDHGAALEIFEISDKQGATSFKKITSLHANQMAEIKSITPLSNNKLVTASTDRVLRFYDLTKNLPSTQLPTIGIPLYKPILFGQSLFYIAKEEDCRERQCTRGHKIQLVEVNQQTYKNEGNPVIINPPKQAIPTCFAFVDIGGVTKLIVAFDNGLLYNTQQMTNKDVILLQIFEFKNPKGGQSVITDMTVIEDGRLVIIYSSGDIFISINENKNEFELLQDSITDIHTGNNHLLSLPGNIVAASFKRFEYPKPFPTPEEIASNNLITKVACGVYMKLQPNGPMVQNGLRIWYGQQEEIVGLSMIPPGIIAGDLSWMSVSKDKVYMLHTYKKPVALPPPPPRLPPQAATPPLPRPPKVLKRLPPPPLPAILPRPKPPGVNAETQSEDENTYNSPENAFDEYPPVNTKEIGIETETPLETIPENIRVNASTTPNINVTIQDIKILHGNKSTPYELQHADGDHVSIIRVKAAKEDTVAYVIPTIEERPGMKLQYHLHESNEGWIDIESGAQIPFNLIEGVNQMDLQVVLIKRNRLNAGKNPINKNMQPVVKSYTIYILKPEDVYLENLQIFGRDRNSNLIRFNRNTLQYSVKVDKNTEFVLIIPKAPKKFELTYLLGDESKPVKSDVPLKVFLKDGINTVTIKVKGVLGIEVEYKFSITREGTGWWVPADMGLPTFMKTNKNTTRAKNIMREMRLANQTRRRINADKASAEARAKAEAAAVRIQRLKNARSGKLVSLASSRPSTPRPDTPVTLRPATPVNQGRLNALRAAQEERGRAAAAALAASRSTTPATSELRPGVFRPTSPQRSMFSGRPRTPTRPVAAWRRGGSRKVHRRTRRRKSRRVRR